MTRRLFVLTAAALLSAATRASAGCDRIGSQLACSLGGRELTIGTQVSETASTREFEPLSLQGESRLLRDTAVPTSALRIEIQNVGRDAALCQKIGNEIYCY